MSVSKRNDGRFIVKFKTSSGWKQKSFHTLADAEAFNAQMEYDEEENKRLTVLESILLYIKGNDLSVSRKKMYILIMERVGDDLGGKYVDDLDRRDLETFRDNLTAKGVCINAINNHVSMLKTVWRWCASEDAVKVVPWEKYKPLPGGTPHRGWNGSAEAWFRIYEACPDWMQWALRTCLAFCCRPGKEVCGITWNSVDLSTRTAFVWMPKVKKQKKVVLPDWWVSEALQKDRPAGGYVCTGAHGGRIFNGTGMRTAWKRVCRQTGTACPLYAVRHIAASMMLEAGADVAAVAAQLGHRNITTTGVFYIHATTKAQEAAAMSLPAPNCLVQTSQK